MKHLIKANRIYGIDFRFIVRVEMIYIVLKAFTH